MIVVIPANAVGFSFTVIFTAIIFLMRLDGVLLLSNPLPPNSAQLKLLTHQLRCLTAAVRYRMIKRQFAGLRVSGNIKGMVASL